MGEDGFGDGGQPVTMDTRLTQTVVQELAENRGPIISNLEDILDI